MRVLLEKEYKVYLDHLDEFLPHHLNRYVLIKDHEVVGFYDSYEQALKAGLKNFGNVPFFIKMVSKAEEVHFFQQGMLS